MNLNISSFPFNIYLAVSHVLNSGAMFNICCLAKINAIISQVLFM